MFPQHNPPVYTSAANEPEFGPWLFNTRAGVITHEPRTCTTCLAWSSHYTLAVMHRSPSLDGAMDERDTFVRGPLTLENVALRNTTEALRQQVQAAHTTTVLLNKELDDIWDRLDDAKETIHKRDHELDDLDHDLCKECKVNDDLKAEIEHLRAQINDLERSQGSRQRKVPHRRSRSESPVGSRGGSHVTSSRPFTPASAIEGDGETDAPAAPRQHLLSRLADRSTATSSSMSLIIEPSPPLPTGPQMGVNLASHLFDAMDILSSATDAPCQSSFLVEALGFPSLLPVVYFLRDNVMSTPLPPLHGSAAVCPDGMSALLPDGTLDFTAHPRYVLALGGMTLEGNWSTSLVPCKYFTSLPVQRNIAACMLVPLLGIIEGGRNGVLTSPHKDPTSDEGLDALFANPGGCSFGFIERIRWTPPEIRTDLHRQALRLWGEMELAERPRDSKRTEPSPRTDTQTWKKWLKAMREADSSFEYIGIPRVGDGYIKAHIEGAKTINEFIPTNTKGQPNRGPLRDTILWAAAAVLSVPQRYPRIMGQLQLQIAEVRCMQQYDTSRFGDENHLGTHVMVRFMASIGVPKGEAECLRAWAAAFVKMDLEKHPHSCCTNDL